ncbi:MAG: IS256 family transposase, partial [Verrucomicrobiae bacterium]|nr:IS256 family transposase [Verrucomicrobiae bacterium]
RPIEGEQPYVFLDAIWLKRSWAGEIKNVSVLVAMSVNGEGFREILGVSEGMKEDHASWEAFLRHLKDRGLKGVRLFVSDKCLGLIQAVAEIYPGALWQRCQVHFYRNVFAVTPKSRVREVAAMLKAIHSQESAEAAREKAKQVQAKLQELKLERAAHLIEEGIEETLRFYCFPHQHHIHIRTNNPLERINREIRRRTRVVGNFPDGRSALMLVCARLRHITHTRWGTRRYMDMSHLRDLENAPPQLARDAFFEQKPNQEQPAANN